MEKMSLWQLDAEIENILSTMVDEETGEINEEAVDVLEQLDMERAEKIENIALYIKNLTAYAADLKAEKMAMAERQKAAENKVERLKKYLQESLNGEKMKTAKFEVSYRTTTKCIVDPSVCQGWLYDNGYFDTCIKVESSVRVEEVKKLLKDGVPVEGAVLQQNVSMSIK